MTGDPTTPGYASTLDAERVPVNETINIPKIPSLPISWKEALPLLKATEGYGFKSDITWQGGLCDVNYYVGPSQAQINLVNINDYQVKKIWNVVGKIPGSEEPEKSVIIGNHRDAWGYGAVDPSSGSAILVSLKSRKFRFLLTFFFFSLKK
jgi:N-acetylated-alpha-linked acidic dipeptidase